MLSSQFLLTAFVIAFSTIPVFLLIRAANKRNRVLRKSLYGTVQKGLLLHYELWTNKIIGLDKNHKLYFITADGNNEVLLKEMLDLNNLKDCQLRINKKEISKNDISGKMEIKHIDINFIMNDNEIKTLSFYNSAEDDILDYGYHLEVGKKWKKIILENKNPEVNMNPSELVAVA